MLSAGIEKRSVAFRHLTTRSGPVSRARGWVHAGEMEEGTQTGTPHEKKFRQPAVACNSIWQPAASCSNVQRDCRC